MGKIEEIVDLVQKVGFPIVMALGLTWFSYNVYKDGLTREARLVERINSFDNTLKEFGETLKVIDNRIDNIEKQSITIEKHLIPVGGDK